MLPVALTLSALLIGAPGKPRPAKQRYVSPLVTKHFKGRTVLFIGDSMIMTGLDIWARHWVRLNGGTYRRVSWASSTTKTWATGKRFEWALRKYKPHVVFVVLGSNELFIPKPGLHAPYVRQMVKKLGRTPYRWIGPPTWAPDTGIIQVLRKNLPASRFYPFNGRKIQRARDGKHPSVYGARTWAFDIFRWYERRLRLDGRP